MLQLHQAQHTQREDQAQTLDRLSDYLRAAKPNSTLTHAAIGAFLQMIANDQDSTVSMTLFGGFIISRHPASRMPSAARRRA
jgi:hypothetical protein